MDKIVEFIKNVLVPVLEKFLTFIVDRRLWVSVIGLIVIFAGVDEAEFTGRIDALVASTVQIVSLVIVLLNLVVSWTNRPPSGISMFDK